MTMSVYPMLCCAHAADGVNPNGYGNDGNMNCDLTLSSSLSLALSLGAHTYATGVLENYFTLCTSHTMAHDIGDRPCLRTGRT